MIKIELQIDDQLLHHLESIAVSQNSTVQELLIKTLELLTSPIVVNDRVIGLFADEPEAMEQIMSEIACDRDWGN
jgi:hypothetical protein